MTNRVAERRKELGLSQAELAERAKISRPYLSIIENNPGQVVTNVVMFRVAIALNSKIEEIFLP